MEILVICPANCTTGGPEALHEFVSELNRVKGVHARIWYWDIRSFPPMPEEYRSYGCEYVTELPEGFNGVLVTPEIWANRIMEFKNCIRAIYWLGIDAYAGWHSEAERGAFLQDGEIIHIAQSEYAYDFLRKLKIRRLVKVVDALNADFYEEYEEKPRGNTVLYNPAKATPFMNMLMSQCRDIEFRPIRGMTRAEVIEAMRSSKLYIDFGEFPGRERIPREAVLCGCCIITGKTGSADYLDDFRHFYKFDSKPSHIWAIVNRMHYVLDNYDECRGDFDRFRKDLAEDINRMQWQAEVFVHEIQRYYPGA